MKFKDATTTKGNIDRLAYLSWGVLLVCLKFILERYVPPLFGQKSTNPLHFYGPLPDLDQFGRPAFLTLVLISLPFAYMGLILTYKRLRDAKLTPWLVVLFCVPYLNLAFFTLLCLLPSKEAGATRPAPPAAGKRLGGLVPVSAGRAALCAILVCGAGGVLLGVLLITGLRQYGWTLFLGLPFFAPLMAVLLYSYQAPRTQVSCHAVAILTCAFMGTAFIGLAFEGLICVLMASPLALLMAAVAGLIGYHIQNSERPGVVRGSLSALIFLPLSLGADQFSRPPRVTVISSIDIQAPAPEVWQTVLAFPPIAEPHEWFFKAGIAYPTDARILGEGVGAVRECRFSTGTFVEPIHTWDPPRRLGFDVSAQPEPMRELSPYGAIHPPHLDGFLRSERGEFLLLPLPGGGTRLQGTTWFHQDLWPNRYWNGWSRYLIGRIHHRVLDHIKTVAETGRLEDAAGKVPLASD